MPQQRVHLGFGQSHRPGIAHYSYRPQIKCDVSPEPLALLCPAAEPPQRFEPAVDSQLRLLPESMITGRLQPHDLDQVLPIIDEVES